MARPREFEPEEVLDSAMHVFWEKGYEATSMADLVDRTGVHRGSLYTTFGNKHDLFLAALKRYCDSVGLPYLASILEAERPVPALRAFFEQLYEHYVETGSCDGCMVTNTAVESGTHDEKILESVSGIFAARESILTEALVRGRKQGDLPADADPRAIARYLGTFILGLSALVRTRPDPAALRDILDEGLRVLQ